MRPTLRWLMGWGLVAVLCQPSCDRAERVASASEGISRETCSVGLMETVSRCGGSASCHVCARVEPSEAICVQPCTIGNDECPSGQTCRPIGELRDAGGYARIGDCPAGYCR